MSQVVRPAVSDTISRRAFLAIGCCGCAAGRLAAATEQPKPVDIGVPSDFSEDGISDKFTPHDFCVVRRDGRLFAMASLCSHMGEFLLRDPSDPDRIKCSAHESMFDGEGRVLVGPATVSLARLGISVNASGKIIVDPAKRFTDDKWEDAGAYIALK